MRENDASHRRRRRARRAVLVVAATLLVSCGPAGPTALSARGLEVQPDGWRGVPLTRERTMPAVVLRTTDGREVDLSTEFLGDPTLLFFGYTSCPDICPVHLATIASAMRESGIGHDVIDVVFITVDPERDTPERIDEFLANFDRRMVGLTGDIADIEAALAALDLPAAVSTGEDPRGGGDLIGHPAQVIGFDAQGRALRVWPFGARRTDWVVDLPRILAEWS